MSDPIREIRTPLINHDDPIVRQAYEYIVDLELEHARQKDDLEAEVTELRSVVERLRGLVHEAYVDGFLQHSVDFHYQAAPPNAELAWEVSDARAALAGEGDEYE